ncbi:egg bindin receptor 1 precursor [Strongylocentrotus purpuratus]|uniref:Egg bindin receptor 1 n=10 Tax=Strongylocentrotus purpuratus TaxID=7668 RepID=Q6VF97_STRPU|nr:egg bindin receptor 1 precursor [Strongylocentrotus purpuratus]AAR03494.1 egg bindin receptor 1 precursor [Strongylocentrotus purpuratus]|eukprot:NP_999830.1 egg bindin receptor 1 precursor [Strongylocentrotus purpuratus]
MAPRCRSTWNTAPFVCFILTAVFIPITFAKPFQPEEFKLSRTDVLHYTHLPDYEYVKPVRLGTRHQRSVEERSVTSTSEYSVEGFDHVFHIQLKQTMDLFNAGLLVKRINENGQVRIEQPETGCYHQGHVKDSEHTSSVSLSTCNGLVGMIRTPEGDFVLKPLREDHIVKMKSSENEVPTHIMYKLSPADRAISKTNAESKRPKPSDSGRRETSGIKYIETSVVADSKMFDYHGDDTEFYIFTILNQVAGLFRDKTLSADLRLLVTSITIFTAPQSNLDLTDELSHSLKNFCEWQKDEKSDISILLTRRDLEIGGNDAVTGKSKDIGGACDPSRRCIIAQDHGPSGTIFTLAHEIGHSLGIYHDDSESGCANNKNIMATDNSGGSEAFQWSLCSNKDLLQFLSTSDSVCLDETEGDFPAYNSEVIVMPGHYYDALKQCQMTFGSEATVADGYIYSQDMCLELQCRVPGRSEDITNHTPALDGTKCGTGRGVMCVHGQCLKVVSMYDCEGGVCVPEWLVGSYGDCQLDCFSYRNVFCVERQLEGTTVLVPDESRCPEDKPTDREYCCGPQPVGEASYQILSGQCSVTCGTGSETRVVNCVDSESNIVDDSLCTDERPPEVIECASTPCPGVSYVLFYDNYGECSVTCDTGVQSRTAFCATSDGTSESVEICRLLFSSVVTERTCNPVPCQGTVVDTFFYQTSPNGACSVTCGEGVQELTVFCQSLAGMVVDDFNCASLQRPASSQICTQEICTDTYRYVATSFGDCSVSCGPGLRSRSIFCVSESNQVVDDSFCAGLVRQVESESCNLTPCTITYTYEVQPFPECTLPCGSQSFVRVVLCRSSEGGVVSSTNCVGAGLEAPPTTFDCNLEPCGNYAYVVGEYGQCSATCGFGIQQRSVACVDLDNDNQTVSNTQCSEAAPPSAILCDQGDCPTEYTYLTSTFSECNCAGIQTRFVVCITFMNGAPVRATDQDCTDAGLQPPTDSQPCEAPITCNPVWRIGAWSPCSVSCGNGVETRVVYCVESEDSNVIIPSTSCDPAAEPASVQICNPGDCITYTWVSENFGDCSVTCGDGVRVRNVLCYAIAGGNFEPVVGSLCNPLLEPPSEEICDLEDCGGVYEATPWSACSVTCALGVQTRGVSCVTRKGSGVVIDEMDCSNMTRPSESRECYLDPCPLPYGCDQSYPTEGSTTYTLQSPGYPADYPADLECSKILVAPEDFIIRITFTDLLLEPGCNYDAVRLVDLQTNSANSLCDEVALPYVYESTSPMLEVLFLTDATVNMRGFSATYQAVRAMSLDYMTGEWGECSVTCGVGTESRDVTCVEEGVEVDVSTCAGLPVPPATRSCTQEDCPLPGACGENILRLAPGLVTSPRFPRSYPVNVTCVNTIRAPPGNVISFTIGFLVFINGGVPCQEGDSVTIQDTSSGEPVISLCQSTPADIISLTNEVTLTFVSDGNPAPQGTGFTLQYFSVSPEVDICGGNITTSGQPIYSPNYPANYDDNVTCVTDITNDEGCISIEFLMMDIDNGDYVNDTCMEDSLTITDYNNPSLSRTNCGDSTPESPWLSASGNVKVSFTSNGANSSQGYIAIPTFVECPQAFWVPLPFGNCSEICGVGNRTRELECVNALTNELTGRDECPDEEPPTTEPCFIEECPSCDVSITAGNSQITFPMSNDYYLYNDECTLTITNENGCMMLFFTSLDIDEGLGDTCYNDYLMIFDPINVYANEPYCGNAINTMPYKTIGNTVELTLRTEDAERFKSFEVFPSFGSCTQYAFIPGPWSECSLSCDGGVRTRDVFCMNLATRQTDREALCEGSPFYEPMEECNTEECPVCSEDVTRPGVIVSPGFGTEDHYGNYDGYDNNLNCIYNITNPNSTECITVSFISFDLGQPSENCSDYVQITDTEGGVDFLYCGLPENTTAPVFYSRSANVEVVFRTGEDERNDGFEGLVGFGTCPEFGFGAGNFSECSVTCGEGVEYRRVGCTRLSDSQLVTDDFCNDQRPSDSRPCSLPECPSCDMVLTEEGIFTSPNSPMNYEDDMECEYTLISGEDQCIRVSFLGRFELGLTNGDCEAGDYIELTDENWEYLDATYCGGSLPPVWRSRSNESSLTLYTDGVDTFRGFSAYLAFVPCPQYGFTVGEYGECDVSCGSGVQTREVECTDLTTQESVAMGLCTDPMPPSTTECNEEPCASCDETYTSPIGTIKRDVFMENEECLYNVTAPEGRCVRIIGSWDLSPLPSGEGGECLGDSITIVDAAYPFRVISLCGRDNGQLQSYGSTALIYFKTDDEDQGGEFQLFFVFITCPEYGFIASNFSECSVSCGEGFRTRDVLCTRLETGENVSRDNCDENEILPNIEPCNEQPCLDCNMFFGDSALFESPGFPSEYPENLQCVYDFYNINDECWRITAYYFDLQDKENDQCRDRFFVEDVGFAGREPYIACGQEFSPVLSFSRTIRITFFSDDKYSGRGFSAVARSEACPVYGFLTGPYSEECSATCGEGVVYRNVTCQDLMTRAVVNDSLCSELRPSEIKPCRREPCPSCDTFIVQDAQYISSPNYPQPYDNDGNCTTIIVAPEGMCINLFFISFELQEPDMYAGCVASDFLAITDLILAEDPYFALDQAYCGNQENFLWFSTQNLAVLSFLSNDEGVYPGYQIYSTFVDCQQYFYLVTPFEECSVTCGLGEVRRDIFCVDRYTNDTVSDDQCAGDVRPIEFLPCYIDNCPVEGCPSDQNVTTDIGNATAVVYWTPPTPPPDYSVNKTSTNNPGDDFPIGNNTVTYSASDDEGNTETCTFFVVVSDNEIPVISGCPSDQNVTTDIGNATAVVIWTPPTATDNSGSQTLTSTNNPGDDFPIGNNTVTYSASDDAGNTETCTFFVVVSDNEIPVFSGCPSDQNVTTDIGNATAVVIWTPPTATDNSGNQTLTSTNNPGDDFPIGNNTVTYSANDDAGNTETCTFFVVVSDNEIPVISGCPSDQNVATDSGNATAVVIWTPPTATDNSGNQTLTSTNNPGDDFPIGNNTVTYSANDDAGNTETCTFFVVVSDNEIPVFSGCPSDQNVTTDIGNATAVVIWTPPTATDNSGSQTLTSTNNPGDDFPIGNNTVTYSASDDAGNTETCTFFVIVSDNENPVISGCPSDQNVATDIGNATAVVIWTPPTATDNSGNQTLTSTNNPGDDFPIGNNTVTYSASDDAGNTETCTFFVVVSDNENPVISGCPSDQNVTTDIGNATAVVIWTPPTATDNSGSQTLTSTNNPGDDFPIGNNTVTYSASDDAGNTETCTFFVVVSDNEIPVFSGCPSDQNVTTDIGNATAVVIWTPPTATDNSGSQTLTSTNNPGDDFPIGNNTVTYSASDDAGNTETCTFFVIVSDNENPVISGCPSDQNVTTDIGNATAVVIWTPPTATDNSGNQTLTSTNNPGDDFPIGNNTVTYSASDDAGNTETCTFFVVVSDNEIPVISGCPSDQNVATDIGNATAVVTWTPPTATDNSVNQTLTSTNNPGDDFPIGNNTVTYSASDDAGNTETCTFFVVVSDNENPVISGCPSDQNVAISIGNAAVVTWTPPTATDNSGNQTLTSTNNPGDDFTIGNNTVTYSASDDAGNTEYCTFFVVVSDCNYTIDGASMVSGNLSSPNYPNSSPSGLSCPITFIIPQGTVLNIMIVEFNLDASCSEYIKLTANVAGETNFCSNDITLPASATYTSDTMVSFLYVTDNDDSNTPYYFAEWQFITV